MMSVDVIGDIRRAYFEQRLPIKEIVRTLCVSRATVRKVVRSRVRLPHRQPCQRRSREKPRPSVVPAAITTPAGKPKRAARAGSMVPIGVPGSATSGSKATRMPSSCSQPGQHRRTGS